MKTREQIYGQEAAGILRDVSMYHALTEMQLLKLYPHKESKIRNLLSYLQKQGRIVQRGEYYRIPADAEESIDHGLSKAVWVLTDIVLIEQPEQIAEIHTPNTSGYCTVSSGGEVQYYQIE